MSGSDPAQSGGAPAAAGAEGEETLTPEQLAEAEQYLSKENFLKLHKSQFIKMKLPPSLGGVVYGKLLAEQFDAVDAFQVEYVEEEGFRVVCKKEGGLRAGSDVFLIDHLWTTTVEQGPTQLREIDGLVDRLWTLADMDFRMEQERQEKLAAAPAAAAPAATPQAAATPDTSADTAAAATAAAAALTLDEGSLCTIMSEAHVSRERAEEAYRACGGDLISSIVWCAGESEQEKQVKASMEAMAEASAAQQLQQTQSPEAVSTEPFDSSSLSLEQKAALLWPALFRAHLFGSYFTTAKHDVSSSSLQASDVHSTLYVDDEIGSAIGQVREAANANAALAPLVVVTLGGVAFSLLWVTRDVDQGEEIRIVQRPTVRLPGVPQVE